MRPVIKTKQDNAMTNSIGAIYAKNETELLWPTDQLSVTRDKNQIGQWRDWMNMCGLRQKLNCHYQSNQVSSLSKTRQANNVINL